MSGSFPATALATGLAAYLLRLDPGITAEDLAVVMDMYAHDDSYDSRHCVRCVGRTTLTTFPSPHPQQCPESGEGLITHCSRNTKDGSSRHPFWFRFAMECDG